MDKAEEKPVVENPINTPQDNIPPQEKVQEPVETQEQIHWRKFRESRDRERKEKEAAEKRAQEKEAEAAALKAAMESLLNRQQPQQQQVNGYEEESEDERIQKKVDAALVRERQQEEERRRAREQQEFPQRLAQTYSDFNQVCTTDNLDYLEFHYPEVAAAFKHAPDGFDKWSAVYKAVKRFVPTTNSSKDAKKAEQNFGKPQSMAVSGATQTGDSAPQMLDDKKRADNWARMQRIMKGGK